MRMVTRVHDRTANGRPEAHVSRSTGFTNFDIFMVDITNLAKRRHTIQVDAADFTRRHTNLRVVLGLRHQLRPGASGADELSTLVATKFDVVDLRTGWDVPQRQRISNSDR